MNILSIQSSVAFGHVGNSAAVFALQRMGIEVWPVNTVQFSNHPGYGAHRGVVLAPETVAEILRGLEERGAYGDCDAVLSGYVGDAATGATIVEAAERVRAANPAAVYCCDPVIGDVDRGVYVRPGIPELLRDRAVPAATVVTPNQFELEFLTGRTVGDLASALDAADALRRRGPEVVLITSLRRTDGQDDEIEMLAVTGEGAWLVAKPALALSPNGTGDLTAALFLGRWWPKRDAAVALAAAASSVFAVLEATLAAGTREIQLIAAQGAIADPPARFTARKVR